jgi:integrase
VMKKQLGLIPRKDKTMAITKLLSGKYQVKVVGIDGQWITKAFTSKKDAEVYETDLKRQKHSGQQVTNRAKYIAFDEYFVQWFETRRTQATEGWRRSQLHFYRDHVRDILGPVKLASVTPQHIARVLNRLAEMKRAEQTRLHVYNIMRRAFSDAIEIFHLLHVNPVHRSFKPKLPYKEARFLSVEEVRRLLLHVEGSPYEIAVWLGAYMGLRVGEIQALRWEDVDFERQILHIHRSYSRMDNVMRAYPKGKRQHSHHIPNELFMKLKAMRPNASSDLVAAPPGCAILDYSRYRKVLGRFCKEVGVRSIATHGLRHSSSGVWMEAGASRDDLRILFAHQDSRTTDRYVHDRGDRLTKVAEVLQLFPRNFHGEGKMENGKK